MTKTPISPTKNDVTSEYKDVNFYDRLYTTENGWLVKVRVVDISARPSSLCFEITGSWADEKTGKARLFDSGTPFIVDPMQLVINADSEVDLASEVEAARLRMVDYVGRAASNYYAKRALTGAIVNN